MSDDRDFSEFCSQLLKTYLSLSSHASGSVEERGGGKIKREEAESLNPDHKDLAQTLLTHQPNQPEPNRVPQRLPEALRNNREEIKQDDLIRLYDIDTSMEQVEEGHLSTLDLITLHLRSYRNILEVQLSDVSELRHRFINYFSFIFIHLMDRCFRDRPTTNSVVSVL